MLRWALPLWAGCGAVELGDDPATAGALLSHGPAAGVDLEVAPDGSLWVTWIEDGALWLTSSTDGARFDEPTRVPLDFAPVASLARRPRLAVDDQRVAVALTDGLVVDARVLVLVAERDDLEWEVTLLDEIGASDTLDQPSVAFAPDGELVAAWKIALDHDYAIVVARELDGWAPIAVEGFPGQPCECCPHELLFHGGDLLLAQRANDRNLREIHVGREDGGGGFEVARVSRNGWVLAGCPFDGPRIARDGDAIVVSWMDATTGQARAWVSSSDDGGATWSEPVRVLPEGPAQASPIVFASEGRRYLTVEALFAETLLLEEAGGRWVERPLRTDGGALIGVDAAGGAAAGLAGVDEEGALWFVPISGGP